MKKLLIIGALFLAAFTGEDENLSFTIDSYIVRPGDTLWSISKSYKPADMDIREYIMHLEQHNNIDANLRVGQEIEMLIFD